MRLRKEALYHQPSESANDQEFDCWAMAAKRVKLIDPEGDKSLALLKSLTKEYQ